MFSITSYTFLIFIAAVLLFYYLLPRRAQWVVLLAASMIFYLLSGAGGIIYVLFTATTVFFAARWMGALTEKRKTYLAAHKEKMEKEEIAQFKERNKRARRRILALTVFLNAGLLCVFKYTDFALEQVNAIIARFGGDALFGSLKLLAPLGISFYTFQAIGYLAEVYWETAEPQKNYFKNLLFISFFPQISQGPISDYKQLSSELFARHTFCYDEFSAGFQRMVWGFFKKMVLADLLAPHVQDIFANYAQYAGPVVLVGAFCHSVQLYADFSGYMDIMCGLCRMMGIRLAENFRLPYFSKSVAEYWRRWHITLGLWFKKYVYYPIATAGWNKKLGKSARKAFGRHFGQTIPATLALIAVWLLTGLWHGASWSYVAWGGMNGFFIILSLWMAPLYMNWNEKLKIRETNRFWRAVRAVRTFILITVIEVIPEVGTLSQGFGLWARAFSDFTLPKTLAEWVPVGMSTAQVILIGAATLTLLTVDLLSRSRDVGEAINRRPTLHYAVCLVLIAAILLCGSYGPGYAAQDFMYFRF